MKDRLAQLQDAAAEFNAELDVQLESEDGEVRINMAYDDHYDEFDSDEEDSVSGSEDSEEFMSDFFEMVREIRGRIDNIAERIEFLKEKHFDILSKPNIDDDEREELDQTMYDIKMDANVIRNKLKLIEKSLSEEDESNKTSADFRIRQTQYNTMYRLLCNVLSEYNEVQDEYREKCKATIKRQVEIRTRREIADEEVEQMIEDGDINPFSQGVSQYLKIDKDTKMAQRMLQEVSTRHEEIKKLEVSIRELYDIFMDFATLVESQGELIDQIENNVNNITEYVEQATKNTQIALQMKRSTRKRKCCCWICIIVGVIILIAILVIVLVTTLCKNGC